MNIFGIFFENGKIISKDILKEVIFQLLLLYLAVNK